MATTFGNLTPEILGAEAKESFGYPSTCDVFALKGDNHEIHIIVDDADPNATTNYDGAPLCSEFHRNTAGSVTVYRKTTATAWTLSSS